MVGTDLSELYLDLARKSALEERSERKVTFKMVDMRNIASISHYYRSFDGVINLYTSFGYYDEETNKDILRQCHEIVRPKGFFALEIINRDWLVTNFNPRSFSRYKGLIVLEDRNFNLETSREHTTWTCLIQQREKTLILKKEITINHRVWSVHELTKLLADTGWRYKGAYPGFGKRRDSASLKESKNIFIIAEKE